MAASRRSASSGVGSSRFKSQLGSPLFFLPPHNFCLSWLPVQRRLKLLLTIVAIILTTAIISHPFVLFHLYNDNINHNVQPQHPLSSSSSSSSAKPQPKTRLNRIRPPHVARPLVNNNTPDPLLRPGCLTEACIHATAATFLTRTYPNRTDQGWCLTNVSGASISGNVNSSSNNNNNQGILLVKVPKGASSTAAGVAIRIARRHDCDLKTGLQWRHQPASNSTFAQRSLHDSYLFTTMRDPADRAVSTIFFHVVSRMMPSKNNKSVVPVVVSDEFLLHYLQQYTHPHLGAISQPGQGGFQLRYTSMEEIPTVIDVDDASGSKNATTTTTATVHHPEAIVQRVHDTIHAYDFVLITERMVKIMRSRGTNQKMEMNVVNLTIVPLLSLLLLLRLRLLFRDPPRRCKQDESLVAMSLVMVSKRLF
jgi:hypothetical protein